MEFCDALRGVVQAILQRQQEQEVLKKWREMEGMISAGMEEEDVLCACLSSGDTGKAFEDRPLLEFLLQEASAEVLKPLLTEVGERRLQVLPQNMKWTVLKTIVARLHEDSFYGMARRLLLLWRGLGFDEDCKEFLAAKQQKHSICVPSLLFFEKQQRNGLASDKEAEEKKGIGKGKDTESLLLGLPIELLSMLCFDGYLDGASLLQLEQTCSFFNSFIANDDHMWRSSYMRRFPDMPCLNSFSVPDSNEELSAIFFSSKYQWQRVLLQVYLYPWRKLYLWREHHNARSNPQDERCLASKEEEEWFLNAVRHAPGQPQLTVQLLEQYIKPLPLRWTLAAAKQNSEPSSSSSCSFADFWQRMLESPPCNLKCALRIDPAGEYFKRDPTLLRLLEERLETYPRRLCGVEAGDCLVFRGLGFSTGGCELVQPNAVAPHLDVELRPTDPTPSTRHLSPPSGRMPERLRTRTLLARSRGATHSRFLPQNRTTPPSLRNEPVRPSPAGVFVCTNPPLVAPQMN
ncbi:hypothetical protein QOT17_001587 [Balamuthia mandrillaris]